MSEKIETLKEIKELIRAEIFKTAKTLAFERDDEIGLRAMLTAYYDIFDRITGKIYHIEKAT